ncbi:hypothetical protein [Bacterioplanoides sp. SCSIO 12839]|uniref:hypothetical protein n=1 Tax=Bacterioplanoides sp. SCSIO 12839 TaxID=2829569 RepID=UPI002102F0A2|nr:hypothetical protein [Bacterioplanoides sp. SCSIO 12839]UTW49844.1 hypothetical protein KFF03_08180 [Bacterioplanoides sp. SCSIO 12839]
MKYLPTTYFFDERKWVNATVGCEDGYKRCGVVIGNLLRDVDEEFKSIIEKHGRLSEIELLMYQTIISVKVFSDIGDGRGPDESSLNATFETISDGIWLMLKTSAHSDYSGLKEYSVYERMLKSASKRLYLEEKWKKIENGRLEMHELPSSFEFLTCNSELDFGESIALQRFQDQMEQLRSDYGKDGSSLNHGIRCVPSRIDMSMGCLKVDFLKVNDSVYKQVYMLGCQIKFYYKDFMDVKFSNYDEVSIFDLIVFWIVASNLALSFLNSLKGQSEKGFYYAFSKDEIVEILIRCTSFGQIKAEQVVSLFTNNKSTIRKSDLYVKPLYEKDGLIHLCLPALLTGQFTRVVDFYVDSEVKLAVNNQKMQNKGRFFENEFERILSGQINNNAILRDKYCRILKVGFKQEKGRDNEEADIVLRIGETYLIIEAKSFVYRVGSEGFGNNIRKIKTSNLGRKRQFFIDEYQRFKEKYDSSANFELNPEKVIACYMSSSPHGVGISVNGFPVVDPSILERYFGNGGFDLRSVNRGEKEFRFYKDANEAEFNLKRYLDELPQLYHYKGCFDYSMATFDGFCEGKEVKFSDPFFDFFNETRVKKKIDFMWDLADEWHSLRHA